MRYINLNVLLEKHDIKAHAMTTLVGIFVANEVKASFYVQTYGCGRTKEIE